MNKTPFEQVFEKGVEVGRRLAAMEGVCSIIEARFGPVTPELRQHLEQLPTEELSHIALEINTASSLAELGLPVFARAEE
jgi:hypothetical protein